MILGHHRYKVRNKSSLIGRKIRTYTYVPPSEPAPTTNVFAYFEEWGIYGKAFSMLDFPADKVTHLLYAFAYCNPSQVDYDTYITGGGTPIASYDNQVAEGTMAQHDTSAFNTNMTNLATLQTNNPDLKVLMSVGGWTLSWNFHTITASSTLRDTFAISCVDPVFAR